MRSGLASIRASSAGKSAALSSSMPVSAAPVSRLSRLTYSNSTMSSSGPTEAERVSPQAAHRGALPHLDRGAEGRAAGGWPAMVCLRAKGLGGRATGTGREPGGAARLRAGRDDVARPSWSETVVVVLRDLGDPSDDSCSAQAQTPVRARRQDRKGV